MARRGRSDDLEPFSRLAPGTLGSAMGCSSTGSASSGYARLADESQDGMQSIAEEAVAVLPGLTVNVPPPTPELAQELAFGLTSTAQTPTAGAPSISPSPRIASIFKDKAKLNAVKLQGSRQRNKLERLGLGDRDRACLKIQRWYRQHSAMYAAYGPMMFSNKDGSISDFGVVSFLSGSRAARFIRVSDTTSCIALSHFLEKFWRLPRPDVLLSVTGSAATLTLTANLQKVFDRGLATAAAMTNAWIFTGGTDSGVMKLVGEAMHKYGLDVPLVGVAPWGAVLGRQSMTGVKGDKVDYRAGDNGGIHGARLNPYHTHQILVDGHREYGEGALAWGHEVKMRAELERTYATSKGVPVVLLVVQGGPGTLDMMHASAEQGSPLLVLSDSGGAATALWEYCEFGIGGVRDAAFGESEERLEQLRMMNEAREGTLLSFFRLADEDAEETMATALLRCLFRNLMFYQISGEHLSEMHSRLHAERSICGSRKTSYGGAMQGKSASLGSLAKVVELAGEVKGRQHDHMQRALLLAVKWNQPDFARRMLMELPATEDYSRPLRKMLQHALEFQNSEIVKLLLDRPGSSIDAINLCQLYLQEDPYNFLRSDKGLQDRLDQRLADGSIARNLDYRLYKEVVGPFLRGVSPLLFSAIAAQNVASEVDLFFWAVFMGNVGLARELWAHVENPLHCALIASDVLRKILHSPTITWGKAKVEEASEALEHWAIQVLDGVEEQDVAHVILSQNVPSWRMGALVELALHMELKAFLAHRHCQSLMNLWWRGGYPGSYCLLSADQAPLALCLYIICPFFNPYLRKAAELEDKASKRTTEQLKDLLFGALAHALLLSSRERRTAAASANLKMASSLGREKTRALPPLRQAHTEGRLSRVTMQRAEQLEDGATLQADGIHHLEGMGVVANDRWSAVGVRRAQSTRALHRQKTRTHLGGLASTPAASSHFGRVPTAFEAFYSVPLVKFYGKAIWQVAFLCLYAYELTHLLTAEQMAALGVADPLHPLPPLSTSEYLFMAWSLTLGLEQLHRHVAMRGYGLTAKLPFQRIVQFAYAVLALALGLRLLSAVPSPDELHDVANPLKRSCYLTYQTLLSMNAVPICIELFNFMWPSLSFGVLTIIMVQMLVDLSLFLVFFAVILLGFSGALLGLSETSTHRLPDTHTHHLDVGGGLDDGGGWSGRLLRGGGMSYDPDDPDAAQHELPLLALPLWAMFTDLEPQRFASIPFSLPLMYAYVMIANVVLVNLLIAMFADTYARIKSMADVEYHYQRFLPIFEHNHVVSAIPPPFSLPLLLRNFLLECSASWTSSAASLAERGVEKLHRLAAARPSNQRLTRMPIAKKYVQKYLLAQPADPQSATPQGLLKKVEAQILALDERVGAQLERIESVVASRGLGGGSGGVGGEDDLRAAFLHLHARLDHLGVRGGTPHGERHLPSTTRSMFWTTLGSGRPRDGSALAAKAAMDPV